ncbi:MAG: MBL fold metallo-hydrolase [Bacteroidaceae bacterium]|nr:MBL fold metallo-hydrolase [Bacteroidaceae bacterium]
MIIRTFTVNPLGVNCYVVHDVTTKEGAIIDCGAFDVSEWQSIEDYIEREGILLTHALQTHVHFDHIFGLDFVHDRYSLRAQAHSAEEPTWTGGPALVRNLIRHSLPLPNAVPQFCLSDGDCIRLGNSELQVIHTPGHTLGGVCFYNAAEHILFAGDTLFQDSHGRYDLPGGDYSTLMESICSRLLSLPEQTRVFPGHGLPTTIGSEQRWYR